MRRNQRWCNRYLFSRRMSGRNNAKCQPWKILRRRNAVVMGSGSVSVVVDIKRPCSSHEKNQSRGLTHGQKFYSDLYKMNTGRCAYGLAVVRKRQPSVILNVFAPGGKDTLQLKFQKSTVSAVFSHQHQQPTTHPERFVGST